MQSSVSREYAILKKPPVCKADIIEQTLPRSNFPGVHPTIQAFRFSNLTTAQDKQG